jgi:hypothetical protein
MKFIGIKTSHIPTKKYDAIFQNGDRQKVVPFGAKGYTDFILSGGDKKKQSAYKKRHANDNLNDPLSPGALSWFILWSSPTLKGGLANYKKHFNL